MEYVTHVTCWIVISPACIPTHPPCALPPTPPPQKLPPPAIPPLLLSDFSIRMPRSKAPLSSSARFCPTVVHRSSLSTITTTTTATTELEHGFTDEDLDRAPLLSQLTLQSLAGAPMPALHDFPGPQSQPPPQPSDCSSPSRMDPLRLSADPPATHPTPTPTPTPTHDPHSFSSRLSRPSKLSDENLQRQGTGIKERVKKSVKMRETERWARDTASNSHPPASSPSSPSPFPSPAPRPDPAPGSSSETPSRSHPLLLSSSQIHSYTHASPSPETLPRPRLSVQPVPSFHAIPTSEPATDCVIPSEHATVHDWQSENTATGTAHLVPASQHPGCSIFPFSPIDVQFVGQTPTSIEFQSSPQLFSPPFLAAATIGSSNEHNNAMVIPRVVPIPVSSDPLPPPCISHPPPCIEETPPTPSSQPSKGQSDPLLRARINLQHALSTTPLARSSPNQSPTSSPVAHYPLQHASSLEEEDTRHVDDDDDDNDDGDEHDHQDNESGLSPIKEDRTAELAAEHSWRIKFTAGPPIPSHHLLNHSSHQLGSSLSTNLPNRVEALESQPSSLSPRSSKSEGSLVSVEPHKEPQALDHDGSTPSTTLINLGGHTTTVKPPQSINTHVPDGRSPKGVAEKPGVAERSSDRQVSAVKRDGSTNSHLCDDRSGDHLYPKPSRDVIVPPQKPQPRPLSPQETRSDAIPVLSPQPMKSGAPQTGQSVAPSHPESLSSRRHASLMCGRPGPHHQQPNPPLSIPASARRPPPEDLLSRLEMEEWRNQTGIDDRYSLSLRPANFSSSYAAAGGSFAASNGLDLDRAGVAGLGAEDRRGIKDRWGNSWGLESHILSPLSEHTELTTVGSILSLSTRKSNHSLRSIDSTGNSIAQRLDQAELNPMQIIKLGASMIPGGVVRSTQTHVAHRSASCPINRIDSPTKLTSLTMTHPHAEPSLASPSLLMEEKMKRREERRAKRDRREKRRAHEIQSSESLAQKQERRRQEKRRKEEFMEKKHQILQQIQESGDNAKLVRDLGMLYMKSNAGVAGLKLAIRHLETSLQMDDSDPVAWSCLGKSWTHLHRIPETETAKTYHSQEATKSQQAHNATIGLKKAIIHSRTYSEVIKYKIEWARFLEIIGRWRDSLGLISELLKSLGKSEFKCWANLGFTALRIVFGWPPPSNLEADDLEQGFPSKEAKAGEIPNDLFDSKHQLDNLTDSDRMKLLAQVHNAFERALALIDEQIVSSHLTHVQNVHRRARQLDGQNNHAVEVESVEQLRAYKHHYQFQLDQVKRIQKKLKEEDDYPTCVPPGLTRDRAPHTSLSSCEGPNPSCNLEARGDATVQSASKDGGNDLITEEVHECNSASLCSRTSSPRPIAPPFHKLPEDAPHPHHTYHSDAPNCLGITTSAPQVHRSAAAPEVNQGSLEPVTQQPNRSPKLPDGDVSSSDGPEVIVQYDDVDTTNDYSEPSKNSDDPFRPASHLGHHHYSIRQPSLTTHPIYDRPHSAQGHLSSGLHHSIEDSKLSGEDERLDQRNDPPIVDLPPPSSDENENLGREAESALLPDSASTVKHVFGPDTATQDQPSVSLSSAPAPTSSDPLLPTSNAESCAALAIDGQPEAPTSHRGHPQDEAHHSGNQCISSNTVQLVENEDEDGEEETGGGEINDETLDRSLLNHKIFSMGLSSPVQRKLRGLDQEELIAFLEMDSDYHAKITKLRKMLIKIEEERDIKRKEMFEKLGILEIYKAREQNVTGLEEMQQEAEDEEVSGRRSGSGLEGEVQQVRKDESNEEEGEGIQEGGSQFSTTEPKQDLRRRLGSSFSSIRSTSSVPSRARLSQYLQQHPQLPPSHRHKESVLSTSRSVCSPPQRNDSNTGSLRSRAFSFNGLRAEVVGPASILSHHHHHHRTTPTADISCNSTAVNDGGLLPSIGHHSPMPPPPLPASADSSQASIALQGIAAILKLATSTQSD